MRAAYTTHVSRIRCITCTCINKIGEFIQKSTIVKSYKNSLSRKQHTQISLNGLDANRIPEIHRILAYSRHDTHILELDDRQTMKTT